MDGKKRIAKLRNQEKWKPPPKVLKVCNPAPIRTLNLDTVRSSSHGFIAKLEKRGYKRLGSGCYSTVLGKDGYDRVIKVTRMQDNWIDYVKWGAERGYAGGLSPKVYSWKKYPGDWSVSVMERMESTLSRSRDSDFALMENLMYKGCDGHTLAQVYMEDILPGSVKFFTELRKDLHASDIYGKNMMLRSDGSFCVTDPCCGRSKLTQTRLRSTDFASVTPLKDFIAYRIGYRS